MAQRNSHLSPRIVEMRDAGATYRQIEETLGVSHKQVQYWCNPRERERRIAEGVRRAERRKAASIKQKSRAVSPELKARRAAERAAARAAYFGVRVARRAAQRARHSGREFSLTEADVKALAAQTHCARTGLPFENYGDFILSFDRINPFGGYTPGNVQGVCWIYNRAKGAGTDEAVLHMARALVAANPVIEWD